MFIEAPQQLVLDPESTTDEVLALLERGLERIRKGWCQGSLHYDGTYCTVGAIVWDDKRIGFNDDGDEVAFVDGGENGRAISYIGMAANHDPNDLTGWNDNPIRRKEDVVAVFEMAVHARRGDLGPKGGGA